MSKYFVVVEYTTEEKFLMGSTAIHLDVFGFFTSYLDADDFMRDIGKKFPDVNYEVVEVQSPKQGLLL